MKRRFEDFKQAFNWLSRVYKVQQKEVRGVKIPNTYIAYNVGLSGLGIIDWLNRESIMFISIK